MSDPRLDPVGTVRRAPTKNPAVTVDLVRLEEGDDTGRGQHVWWARVGSEWRVYHHNEVARFPIVYAGSGRVEHPDEYCWCRPDDIPVKHDGGAADWVTAHHMPLQTEAQQAARAVRIFEAIAQVGRSES